MTDSFARVFPPLGGRVHEVCGPGAPAFCAICCGLAAGEAVWLGADWQREGLNPAGLAPFCDPGRLLMVRAKGHADLLALTEESLRSGAVRTVVAEVSRPLDLTAGRRLQLAAGAGRTLGLIVLPEGMGSNAAETRWHCRPVPGDRAGGGARRGTDSTLLDWQLIKNKKGTLGGWTLRWDEQAHRIAVVSAAGQ